jgi:hypothetical protein
VTFKLSNGAEGLNFALAADEVLELLGTTTGTEVGEDEPIAVTAAERVDGLWALSLAGATTEYLAIESSSASDATAAFVELAASAKGRPAAGPVRRGPSFALRRAEDGAWVGGTALSWSCTEQDLVRDARGTFTQRQRSADCRVPRELSLRWVGDGRLDGSVSGPRIPRTGEPSHDRACATCLEGAPDVSVPARAQRVARPMGG